MAATSFQEGQSLIATTEQRTISTFGVNIEAKAKLLLEIQDWLPPAIWPVCVEVDSKIQGSGFRLRNRPTTSLFLLRLRAFVLRTEATTQPCLRRAVCQCLASTAALLSAFQVHRSRGHNPDLFRSSRPISPFRKIK